MKIDVLYFAGCPNHTPTVQRVSEVVRRLGIDARVNEIEVKQGDDPKALRFAGSPTVLVNGRDIDPGAPSDASYGFGCRMFSGAGVPPVEMIERALREVLRSEGSKSR